MEATTTVKRCRCGTVMDLMHPGFLMCPHCDRPCFRTRQHKKCLLCESLEERK